MSVENTPFSLKALIQKIPQRGSQNKSARKWKERQQPQNPV